MKYDAIIVLGGGIKDDGSLPENQKRRVEKAIELFNKKLAARIVMSGKWSKARDIYDRPPQTEAHAMERYALDLGVSQKVIDREEKSCSTSENASYLLNDFLIPNNWRKLLIVTSEYHLKRAMYVFSQVIPSHFTLSYETSTSSFRVQYWIGWKIKDFILSVAMVFAKLRIKQLKS